MSDSLRMRDALQVAFARAYGRWRALERGWRATVLSLGVIAAIAVVGP
ncbi:hypothetical protein [Haloferax mucosum]|nr:hypothetical protein [Haloferax mucosum]